MNKILKIMTDGQIPSYQTSGSCGIDLYCSNDEDIIIEPGDMKKINTGLRVQIPQGFFGAVYPRSSTGVKRQLMLANTVGVIDSDYRGEIMIFMYNYGNDPQVIKNGDRIAQLVIQPYEKCELVQVESLDETDRGESGFGSTGN
ncbi:dUTP diphosphatase [Anaerococcus sp. Marseille-Q7828]|uniref:dUTP diphosphatase n=1 Tax=Anaerococcus sp. Marseille-Q7828 TaxID=3036300 RepID=UPI0024AD0365|nr:dUTP diphosphatase [Anaerococcus sp. Marseille-Q7828]